MLIIKLGNEVNIYHIYDNKERNFITLHFGDLK